MPGGWYEFTSEEVIVLWVRLHESIMAERDMDFLDYYSKRITQMIEGLAKWRQPWEGSAQAMMDAASMAQVAYSNAIVMGHTEEEARAGALLFAEIPLETEIIRHVVGLPRGFGN